MTFILCLEYNITFIHDVMVMIFRLVGQMKNVFRLPRETRNSSKYMAKFSTVSLLLL